MTHDDVSRETEPGRDELARYFGDRWPVVEQFHRMLSEQGELLGLIGPREIPRLWSRHLVNCAAIGELMPAGSDVIDVGSGAGLPGIVLAAARPDLTVELVEAKLRRVEWLRRCASELGLERVTVTRSRAEELPSGTQARSVTARAVAPLTKLVGWCLPLMAPDGQIVAIKGEQAREELASVASQLRSHGLAGEVRVLQPMAAVAPTTVVVVRRA